MAYIRMISETEATGNLAALYARIAGIRGGVSNVLKIHSLLPQTLEDHFNLYKTLMFDLSKATGLSRKLLEMVAVIVSGANQCDYCVQHHSVPLKRWVRDDSLLEALQKQYWGVLAKQLEHRILYALMLAVKVTLSPSQISDEDIHQLKDHDFSDEQILHLILTINYFNFVNRNVLAFGLELEPDFEKTTR